MLVGPNTRVTLCYVLKDPHGNVLDNIHEATPVRFAFDQADFPQGFLENITGMGEGQSKSFAVEPARGFGERREKARVRVHKRELPQGPVEVGGLFRKVSPAGRLGPAYTVAGFVDDWVLLDPNHPHAGKTLRYDVSILEVRKDETDRPE